MSCKQIINTSFFMLAIHNAIQHAIECNKLITTAAHQAASGPQSCININTPVDILQYPNVYMCETQKIKKSQ